MPNAMMVGKMWFKYYDQGWSESYYLDGDSFEAQETIFKNLCLWRRGLMAKGIVLAYASLSMTNQKGDSFCIQSSPVGPTFTDPADTQERPNDVETALLVRLQTTAGKHGNRLIRGLQDSLVYDKVLQEEIGNIVIPGATAPPLENLTRVQFLTGFLGRLVKDTFYARKNAVDNTWDKQDWTRVFYRDVRNRKTGAPFGQTRGRRAAAA